MPFWRREKPLHERLAEQAGLEFPNEATRDVAPWHQAGVDGIARPRRWDAVVVVEAELPGEVVHFVTLEDGTVVVDEEVPEGAVAPLADAVETQLDPPYRAEANRREAGRWAVGATKIRTERISDPIDGDRVELATQDGERTLLVDGALAMGSLPELEALAAGMGAYVIRADRIDGDVWEVKVVPL